LAFEPAAQWRRVPKQHGTVTAPGRQTVAIRTEHEVTDVVGVSAQGEDLLTGPGVPDLQRAVTLSRRQAAAVRTERQGAAQPEPAPRGSQAATAGRLPQGDDRFRSRVSGLPCRGAGHGESPAVAAERCRRRIAGIVRNTEALLARLDIPETNRATG